MSKYKLIPIIAVLVILVGGVWLATRRVPIPHEPIYQGKAISVWLDDQHSIDGRIELADASVRAVQAIGTNAIPYLLATLECSDSQTNGGIKRRQAMYGFRALGMEAQPAVPKIVSLVLTSSDNGIHYDAINALTSAPEEAITLFTQALESQDSETRVRAAFALGCLRQAPQISVPALAKALSDPDAKVREGAVGSLGPYQAQARPLIPQITVLLNDTDASVRSRATESLGMIQPK